MKEEILFKADMCLGSVELVTDIKTENGKLWLGGHAIHRDRNGNITKVTEPEYYCYIE